MEGGIADIVGSVDYDSEDFGWKDLILDIGKFSGAP